MISKNTARDNRLRRIRMRAGHRGIKEMDVIFGRFVRDTLDVLTPAELDLFEELMCENDQRLFAVITKRETIDPKFGPLIERVRSVNNLGEA